MKRRTIRYLKGLGIVFSIVAILVLVLQIHFVQVIVFRLVMKTAGDWIVSSFVVAIDGPKFVSAVEADLKESDEVLALRVNGEAKAYPIDILACHQAINDQIGDIAILVTYCPWSYSARAFDRRVQGRILEFSVKGIRRNSLLMADKHTNSEWLQMSGRAISGTMVGKELKPILSMHTTWGFWKRHNPDSLLLSEQNCLSHDHGEFPNCDRYEDYRSGKDLISVPRNQSGHYHPKEIVLGVQFNGESRAYPLSELTGRKVIQDTLGNQDLAIVFDEKSQTAGAFYSQAKEGTTTFSADGGQDPLVVDTEWVHLWSWDDNAGIERSEVAGLAPAVSQKAFWFAWFDFHPDTSIWTSDMTGRQ